MTGRGRSFVAAVLAMQALACTASPAGAVTVGEAWVRPTVDASTPTAAYLTISNTTGADDTLLGASSPAAQSVEIHRTSSDMPGMSGMTGMAPVASVTIPAGGVVRVTVGRDDAFAVLRVSDQGPGVPPENGCDR